MLLNFKPPSQTLLYSTFQVKVTYYMNLFNHLLEKIQCESIEGLWWELQDLYSDISDLDFVETIEIKKIDDIYHISMYFNKELTESEIDSIIFPYIRVIRYHHGLFYERKQEDNGFCYNLITFQENLKGFACRIHCIF